jgi:hypothetical protein
MFLNLTGLLMDLSHATLESYFKFHKHHEELNRNLKVAVIALNLLKLKLDAGATMAEIKGIMYGTTNMWGGMPDWTDPVKWVDNAIYDLADHGVVRVFSAFDVFLDELQGELQTCSLSKQLSLKPLSNSARVHDVDEEEPDRCFRMLNKYGIQIPHELHVKPIYNYYRLSRNCIAHRSSFASSALATLSDSSELKAAIQQWRTITTNRTSPPVRSLVSGEQIQFTHRDAIFSSSVTRHVALAINRVVIDNIGIKGLILLIAQNHILKVKSIRNIEKMRDVHSVFKAGMGRIEGLKNYSFKKTLIELGIEEQVKKKFNKLRIAALKT